MLPQQPLPGPANNRQSWLLSLYYVANCLSCQTAAVTNSDVTLTLHKNDLRQVPSLHAM